MTEQECLAIVLALKKLDMYLHGTTFTIQMDHLALAWLKNPRSLAQWALSLARYNYSIEYRRAALNKAVDALSRAQVQDKEDGQTKPKSLAVGDESGPRCREEAEPKSVVPIVALHETASLCSCALVS